MKIGKENLIMKILWISNVIFPEACTELNIRPPVVGGWMHSAAVTLLEANPNLTLAVAALYNGNTLIKIEKYKIKYYLIPSKGGDQKYNSLLESHFICIRDEFKPDVIHIHGSEYPHSLAWVTACGRANVVVSIQGLVSIYAKYYLGGIPEKEIKKSRTFRDLILRDSLFSQQLKMFIRGKYEVKLLESVNHVIGRTLWDRSNSWAINPCANYHFCNETLRDAFYSQEWKYINCKKHTIFLSQAHYPIKGIQQIVKALPVVLNNFPDTMVYISGNNFFNSSYLRRNGFANFLLQLMKKHGVADRFKFLGTLNEGEMVSQYLKANVFVCPSSIENSPNSLGEAQLLGTPSIASYTGGTMEMINDGETGFLYRFEETNLLAMRICNIFENPDLAETLSKNGRIAASKRHNKSQNAESLDLIYRSIRNENSSNL